MLCLLCSLLLRLLCSLLLRLHAVLLLRHRSGRGGSHSCCRLLLRMRLRLHLRLRLRLLLLLLLLHGLCLGRCGSGSGGQSRVVRDTHHRRPCRLRACLPHGARLPEMSLLRHALLCGRRSCRNRHLLRRHNLLRRRCSGTNGQGARTRAICRCCRQRRRSRRLLRLRVLRRLVVVVGWRGRGGELPGCLPWRAAYTHAVHSSSCSARRHRCRARRAAVLPHSADRLRRAGIPRALLLLLLRLVLLRRRAGDSRCRRCRHGGLLCRIAVGGRDAAGRVWLLPRVHRCLLL